MKEQLFIKQLNKESNKRNEMLSDALEAMSNYSEGLLKKEADLEQSKIEEIKYRTTIKEQSGYIKIYQQRLEQLEQDNEKMNKEIMFLRKKILTQGTKLSSLQSILDLFIREYGIEQISSIAKIEEEQLKKLIEIE